MAKAGDVVIVDFPGVQGVKRRPAVVVSSELYHQVRPDVTVAILTSQIASAATPTDHVLVDWRAAGLKKPSAYRSFFLSIPRTAMIAVVGQTSDRDRQAIAACVRAAMMA